MVVRCHENGGRKFQCVSVVLKIYYTTLIFHSFDKSKLKFQLSDPDAYFVHHMSMYEHFLHKKVGFAIALNKTIVMSQAAFKGECENLHVSERKEYIALIPFYGGLPPNVTKDLSVKSIGQGNSLVCDVLHILPIKFMMWCYDQVDTSTKALQATASVCSCLKYFGKVVIGVARDDDKSIIMDMVSAHLWYIESNSEVVINVTDW